MIDLHPAKCNLCGGTVEYASNAKIYGKKYGSGKCYICLTCKAYVGTHKPRPAEALGILADAEMRLWKIKCHALFDKLWKSELHNKNRGKSYYRDKYYGLLAAALGIGKAECHFGYFGLDMLKRAYEVLGTQKLKARKNYRKRKIEK